MLRPATADAPPWPPQPRPTGPSPAGTGPEFYPGFSRALLVAVVAHKNMVATNPADTRLDHLLSNALDCLVAARGGLADGTRPGLGSADTGRARVLARVTSPVGDLSRWSARGLRCSRTLSRTGLQVPRRRDRSGRLNIPVPGVEDRHRVSVPGAFVT